MLAKPFHLSSCLVGLLSCFREILQGYYLLPAGLTLLLDVAILRLLSYHGINLGQSCLSGIPVIRLACKKWKAPRQQS